MSVSTKTIEWKVDAAHSELVFQVKHLGLTSITGYFRNFSLYAETEDENFTHITNIRLAAAILSVDTNNTLRDDHLRSADFFDAEQYPKLTFTASNFDRYEAKTKLEGELTMKGVTRLITLNVAFAGIVVDDRGQTKAGFTIDGVISRHEFGLTWTNAGDVVVDDSIRIHASVQLIRQD